MTESLSTHDDTTHNVASTLATFLASPVGLPLDTTGCSQAVLEWLRA